VRFCNQGWLLRAGKKLILPVVALGAVGTHGAKATIISASSSGYGLSVSVQALGMNLAAGPLPSNSSGSAPAPYNVTNSVANVNVTAGVPVVVSGLVGANAANGAAASTVTGLAGVVSTNASGGVVGANINTVTIPVIGNGVTLLGL